MPAPASRIPHVRSSPRQTPLFVGPGDRRSAENIPGRAPTLARGRGRVNRRHRRCTSSLRVHCGAPALHWFSPSARSRRRGAQDARRVVHRRGRNGRVRRETDSHRMHDDPGELMATHDSSAAAAVYVQTNDAAGNEVLAFERGADGTLAPLGRFPTGGRGTGEPHLPSQGSVALTEDGRWLLAVNAGSDDASLFAVQDHRLRLVDCLPSGGATPTSVAVKGDLVYVLNNGTSSIAGFRIDGDRLVALDGSARPLSAADADPAQVAFSR